MGDLGGTAAGDGAGVAATGSETAATGPAGVVATGAAAGDGVGAGAGDGGVGAGASAAPCVLDAGRRRGLGTTVGAEAPVVGAVMLGG